MMNFMSGRSGFCEEITTSRAPILPPSTSPSTSTSPSPSPFSLNFGPAAAAANAPHPDGDDHMGGGIANTSGDAVVIGREHMFDKVVTPSDVGKLNRLVIPKQHAEKYFPLDSSSNEKGLLLNFEDRNGKPWRFRYSYWNSSQSYVMTKGWSRFVKEKKLDAGDIVSFQRGLGDAGKGRLFIDWRHRPDMPEIPPPSFPHQFSFHRSSSSSPSVYPWLPSRDYSHLLQTPNQSHYQHHQHYQHHALATNYNYSPNYAVVDGNLFSQSPASIMYLRSAPAAASATGGQQLGIRQTVAVARENGWKPEQMVFNSVPVVQGKGDGEVAAAAKRLRLFGVNMEYCPVSGESENNECDTQPQPKMSLHHLLPHPPYCNVSNYSPHPHPHPSSSVNQIHLPVQKDKGSISLDLDI